MDIEDLLSLNENSRSILGDLYPEIEPIEIPLSKSKWIYTAKSILEKRNEYYVIPYDSKFYYFKVGKVVPRGDYLFTIEGKKPPVLREGMIVINKEIYHVTTDDLLKNVIRKSRKLKLRAGAIRYEDFVSGDAYFKEVPKIAKQEGKITRTKSSKGTGEGLDSNGEPNGGQTVRAGEDTDSARIFNSKIQDVSIKDILKEGPGRELSRSGKDTELEESKAIDLAFKREVKALLGNPFTQEGESWEDWEIEESSQP